MQKKGLEPSWYCYHTDLNRARLPIPPFLQAISIVRFFRNCVKNNDLNEKLNIQNKKFKKF